MDLYQEKIGDLVKKAKATGLFSKKKEARTDEMSAQSEFSADGPALFMEGVRKNLVTVTGNPSKKRLLWSQPIEVSERVSKRVLRLRKGEKSRGTSKPL